ncbi:SHOCT domain-containing protein [Desulfovibrio aminophilus]|uniref:SHOCT domain-containing protein n=1 Tax=Desulfovibrio aminophilus TaxID=81425 RepID=UPI00339539DB
MRADSLDCLRLFAQYGPGSGPGFGPGGSYQMMSPLGGGLVMLLGLALVIILAVWLLRRPGGGNDETPLTILKARYARGEISREEFERMKKDIMS